jgi:hypothetical protein
MLGVSAKTLRQWLKRSDLSFASHPTDARIKCLTVEQVQQLATLHGRSIEQEQPPASEPPPTPLVQPEKPAHLLPESHLPSPFRGDSDGVSSLSSLEATVVSLQQQVAELALQLVHERELRYEHRLSTLEALIHQSCGQSRASQEVEMETLVGVPNGPSPAGRCFHPAELRARSRAIALIEYGAHGNYVTISPQVGELFLTPDSPEWFDWLATLSSFRFVGPLGRFSACRRSDDGQQTRSWIARRFFHGHDFIYYLGVTDRLTIEYLEQVAATLQSRVDAL